MAVVGLEAVHFPLVPTANARLPRVWKVSIRLEGRLVQRYLHAMVADDREPVCGRIGARKTRKKVFEAAILLNDNHNVLDVLAGTSTRLFNGPLGDCT
jgi:hypothetical protein